MEAPGERAAESSGVAVPDNLRRGGRRTEVGWLRSARDILDLLAAATHRESLAGVRVLDIGCGTKLVKVLIEEGRPIGEYVGLDIEPRIIDFNRDTIVDPRFSFHCLHVANEYYRPDAPPLATLERYPVDDGAFDIVCGWSLLTHLSVEDIGHVLRLARRAVAPDGYFLGSIFLNQFSSTGHGLLDRIRRAWEEDGVQYALRLGQLLREESTPESGLDRAAAGQALDFSRALVLAAVDEPAEVKEVFRAAVAADDEIAEVALANLINGDPARRAEVIEALHAIVGDDPIIERAAQRAPESDRTARARIFPTGPPKADTVEARPRRPGLAPVHRRAVIEDLVAATGWSLEQIVEPTPSYHHVLVLRPV